MNTGNFDVCPKHWLGAFLLFSVLQGLPLACGDDPNIECDFPSQSRCNEEENAREICVSINDSRDTTLVKHPCRLGTRCYVTSPGQTDCLIMSPN